ncbi:hypothetical protein [Falsibacillus pallidus]|uniref:Uncharacterized protein n=1 Tax=Falsibacillus pallidus TaxID=493781 RepID=A0A370H056_9BACI|nr:hypothetical protein [Falsibacillus pallidus]RDI47433.1 hypothetical protein DFR59_10188 [Falsibacillus pallidus]
MAGSFVWNLWSAILGFTLFFALSIAHHTPSYVMIGSSISALLFLLIAFVFRFIIGEIADGPVDSLDNSADAKFVDDEKGMDLNSIDDFDAEKAADVIKELLK